MNSIPPAQIKIYNLPKQIITTTKTQQQKQVWGRTTWLNTTQVQLSSNLVKVIKFEMEGKIGENMKIKCKNVNKK